VAKVIFCLWSAEDLKIFEETLSQARI